MNNLDQLIRKIEQCEVTLSIRDKLYNRVAGDKKGNFIFTHTESEDCLITSKTWLSSLMQRHLLYDTSKVKPNQSIEKPKSIMGKPVTVNEILKKPLVKSIEALQVRHNMSSGEASELQQLLIDMKRLNFSKSAQLSKYIVRNKLGYKYPTISGIARMSDGEHQWDFDGGFPTNIYRIICTELCLSNQGSRATVVGFTSYSSIDELF